MKAECEMRLSTILDPIDGDHRCQKKFTRKEPLPA
jgi:hypothetical protein